MGIQGIDTSGASAVANAKTTKEGANNELDKDAFLKLLVTQMQNQDPLEPTDNTEYMSQLAQFSSLEAMQNISSQGSVTQAMSLTGQYVIMNTTDAAGNLKQISGLVDFVTVTDGKAMLNINGTYYSYDDFDSVVDPSYVSTLNASNASEEA
ncbi:MAG: hypothetical protein IKQ71_08525 [Lachnospiraceae bacterium]|nr:hypothetical protein [Lachnospiraceae bacterium]